jgi:hypothetical protein
MGEENTIVMNKIYQFDINTNGCNFELWLNDIRIECQMLDMPIVTDKTINRWLKSGSNKLKVILLPISSQEEIHDQAYVRIKIHRGDNIGGYVENKVEIASFNSPDFKHAKESQKGVPLKRHAISENFDTTINYENKIFSDLQPLSMSPKEIIKEFRSIIRLFKKQKTEEILDLMVFKFEEYAHVINKTMNQEEHRQRLMLKKLFNHEFIDVNLENYQLVNHMNGMIVSFEDEYGTPPIAFYKGDNMFSFYPVYIGRLLNGNITVVL